MQLNRVSERITNNRVVAGLHFPVDNSSGRLLGDTLAGFLVSLCTKSQNATWKSRTFTGTGYPPANDWDASENLDPGGGHAYIASADSAQMDVTNFAPTLRWLWNQARAEQQSSGF